MKSDLLKSWLTLLGLHALVSALIFSYFLSGKFYFAYIDIGSDSYREVVPYAMYLTRAMALEGFTGWSFQLGLGGPTTALFGDLATLLQSLVFENILPARIYIYLLKVVLGGSFFLLFIRHYLQRWESAVISALAYSFCGFMVINGQWDIEATAFVFYPLGLWAITRHLRTGGLLALPLVIAATLFFGTFFVSLGVFLVFACAAFVACSYSPRATLKAWIFRIFPLVALGYLLAAPHLLPVIFQLMDSSRVGGGQSLVQGILSKSLSVSDWSLVVAQIGGIFHKDIFGVGSNFQGYFNYLEGPGFFIGITLFLLIPQLWAGTRADKKALVLAVVAFAAYILFPVFRYAAMGFAAPYFRISTLWVSMLGLILAAKALDQVIIQGIRIRLLAAGLAIFGVLLAVTLLCAADGTIWTTHVEKIATLAVLSTALLMLAHRKLVTPERLPLALMLVVVVEIVVIARPSYVEGRAMVWPTLNAYQDKTPAALAAIRRLDGSTFRIEKDYSSVSLADAMAQDYMGIKSYSLHSRGMVDFHIGTGLIPPSSKVVNYSNWLTNAGPRYMLNSLLGVKYFIAANVIDWPGFVEVGNADGLRIYRNDMALPFGIVQTRQVTKKTLGQITGENAASASILTDVALINAAVVDQTIPDFGGVLDLETFAQSKSLSLKDHYFAPVALLQQTGLNIDLFSSSHITGHIAPKAAGILVFSIPFNSGWTLKVDGLTVPLFRANFGMLAATVGGGPHSVELSFETPGRRAGWLLGAVGLCALVLAGLFSRRASAHRYGSL
nr:YfhO family protein [Rhodoferax sp.]